MKFLLTQNSFEVKFLFIGYTLRETWSQMLRNHWEDPASSFLRL